MRTRTVYYSGPPAEFAEWVRDREDADGESVRLIVPAGTSPLLSIADGSERVDEWIVVFESKS